jgi:cytochrome P450
MNHETDPLRVIPLEYDPFSARAIEDPYPIYARLRRSSPVYRNDVHNFWALARFDDVQAALRDAVRFSNARGVDIDATGPDTFGPAEGGNFLDADPPLHTHLRKIVHSAFTPRAISSRLQRPIETEVHRLLDQFDRGSVVDLAQEFAWSLPTAVVSRWLGFSPEDQPRLQALNARLHHRDIGEPRVPAVAIGAALELRGYMRELVALRASVPSDDLTSAILAGARERGSIDGTELAVNMGVLFYAAGIETTAALIGNAVHGLWSHPAQRARLLDDLSAAPAAVEEFLRFDSPLQHTMRTTTCDVELHGSVIPAGSRVLLLLASANRDETRWENPERLDIERPSKRHIDFGEGIHHCIGAPLARLEVPIALREFLLRFPSYSVEPPAERMSHFLVRGFDRLPVALA